MAANLITCFYFSAKYLNSSCQINLLKALTFSFIFSTTQILFFNNLLWIFSEGTSFDLSLSVVSRLRLVFNREIHNKNIYYGVLNHTNVVLKEYPGNKDCVGIDDEECRLKYLNHVTLSSSEELKSLVVCPTVDDFLDEVTTFLYKNISFESVTEPLILEMLPSESYDLSCHIPKSFGVLGNVLIEEYVGPTLSSFYNIDWTRKAKIAVELLKMARVFTFGHENFSFYFTDISPDNIAIRDNLNAVLIDLDHVIVVDRSAFNMKSQHISQISSVFMFSTQDICKHSVSDLNYYSVCEHIFRHSTILPNNWLLAEFPEEVENNFPELRGLVEECAVPVQTSDRISAGKALEELLASIVTGTAL